MAVTTAITSVPVGAAGGVLPARDIALSSAVKLGVFGGLTAIFVSAIGMVQTFDERELIGPLTLGRLLLVAIPCVFGYVAGKPPPALEGFAPPSLGARNVIAGTIAGVVTGVLMAAFVVFIDNVDIRDTFINVTPQLVSSDPRILTYGLDLVPGIAVILAVNLFAGALGGAIHLLASRWRQAVLTAVGAVIAVALLGPMVQQILRGIQDVLNILTEPIDDFLYEPNGALSIPAAVIIGVLAFGLKLLLTRDGRTPVTKRVAGLPNSPRRVIYIGGLAVMFFLLAMLPQIMGTFLSGVFNTAGIFLMMALGLNIVVGFAGLLDLGYVAFFAVGAYTTALVTAPNSSLGWGWVFWAAVPVVLLTSALAGIMVGTPVLRMRGDYLAIVTLGFGEIFRITVNNLDGNSGPQITRGPNGIPGIPELELFGFNFGESHTVLGVELGRFANYYLLMLVIMAFVVLIFARVNDSRVGRAWVAIREDEIAASAMGINTFNLKLVAFALGACLAGLAGTVQAHVTTTVTPDQYVFLQSAFLLAAVVLGGMGTIVGPLLGSTMLLLIPEKLRFFSEARLFLFGLALVLIMRFRPEGLVPSRRRQLEFHDHTPSEGDALGPSPALLAREAQG
jgi:branched-chain amino acid transport system permease protein